MSRVRQQRLTAAREVRLIALPSRATARSNPGRDDGDARLWPRLNSFNRLGAFFCHSVTLPGDRLWVYLHVIIGHGGTRRKRW
jgi:hypothetical protein